MTKTNELPEKKGLDAPLVMRRFKILYYDRLTDTHLCTDEKGNKINLDLSTDSTFPEINDNPEYCLLQGEEYYKYMESFDGKEIECEGIFPYQPLHFVVNGRFLNGA
jgi:hypothetical protein